MYNDDIAFLTRRSISILVVNNDEPCSHADAVLIPFVISTSERLLYDIPSSLATLDNGNLVYSM